MGESALSGLLGIIGAIIGVAIIAVLVSKQSNTSAVITTAGQSLSGIIGAAVNPGGGVTGINALTSGGF